MKWKLLVCALLVLIAVSRCDELTNDDLNLALVTANRALNYLLQHSKNINLDAALGARMMAGTIGQILATYSAEMENDLRNNFNYLHKKADHVANVGSISASLSTPYYFSRAQFLLEPQIWNFLLPRQDLLQLEGNDHDSSDEISEYASDFCLSEFASQKRSDRCNISNACFDNMNIKTFTSYSLTHQVLYYLVGIGFKCEHQLNKLAASQGVSLEHSLVAFCSQIKREASRIADHNFPKETRDLFMEQIGLCGIAGFTDIAKREWLQRIASWQSKSGCFHKFLGEDLDMENFNPNRYGNYRKRSERAMSSGTQMCLSHRTSVALVALTAYFRRFVENRVLSSFSGFPD